jgi:hypothetical protein
MSGCLMGDVNVWVLDVRCQFLFVSHVYSLPCSFSPALISGGDLCYRDLGSCIDSALLLRSRKYIA